MLDTTFPPMPEHITEIQSRHYRLMEQIRRGISADKITPSQAVMIMSLGMETVKASDLIRNGYYLGTNASYNLQILEKSGYIKRKNFNGDKRQKLVALSSKGLELCVRLRRKFAYSTEPAVEPVEEKVDG